MARLPRLTGLATMTAIKGLATMTAIKRIAVEMQHSCRFRLVSRAMLPCSIRDKIGVL